MTIIIDPKELEHTLMFASITVFIIGLCYIVHKFYQNENKK